MVYPCFYYSLKGVKILNILVYYTTKETLPRFYRLKHISSWVRYNNAGICLLSLHAYSTFFVAIQDHMEFMIRLVETIALSYILYEFFLMRIHFEDFLGLVNYMKTTFSTVDTEVVRACKREERTLFFSFATFLCGAISLGCSEVFVRRSDEWNHRRAQMYGYGYPDHPVPLNVYIPGHALDLSAPPLYYFYLGLVPYYALEITAAASLIFTGLGIFSIHIKGQYKMIQRYVHTIHRPETDEAGRVKYFTNIVTGEYFTVKSVNPHRITLHTPRTSLSPEEAEVALDNNTETPAKTLAIMRHIMSYHDKITSGEKGVLLEARTPERPIQAGRREDYYNPIYEEYLLKQIVQWQQHLSRYRKKVERNMRPLVIVTCFVFISLVAICSQIVLKCHYKITYSFVFTALLLHVSKLVEFSDQLDSHSEAIPASLYFQCGWYRKPHNFRNIVRLMMVRSMRSEHYSFFGGLVTFDRPLLLSLFSDTYTFINWLIYLNSH